MRRIAWPQWTGFGNKTLWHWLELLGTLAVPIMVALVGIYFTVQQSETQNEIEQQRAQAAALQAYLDQMGSLLLKNGLRESEAGSEERTLARARTLTALDGLDPDRKGRLLQFLNEANLINPKDPVIDLSGADATDADLSNDYLGFANLRGANLSGADLSAADLSGAILTDVQGFSPMRLPADSLPADLEGATMPNGQQMPLELPEKGRSPHPVEIEAGVYPTDEFRPAFTFKVDKGWSVLRSETSGELSMQKVGGSREGAWGELIITNAQSVYAQAEQLKQSETGCGFPDPSEVRHERNPIMLPRCPAPKNVDEWISWFQNHPKLETSKPVPVSVGGVSGKRIDVKLTSEPRNVCNRETRCVPLFRGVPPNFPNAHVIGSEFTHVYAKGYDPDIDAEKDRFVIVDVEGETVIIEVTATFGDELLDTFSQTAQKILDTVEWKPRGQEYVDWLLKSIGSGEDRQTE